MLLIPSQEILRSLFEYKDGKLYWLKSLSPRVSVGSIAGNKRKDGYWRVAINKIYYNVHRVIWVYHNGDIPKGMQIDHINGNQSDNRIENLRLCTHAQNEWNKPRKARVSFESGKWRARYSHNNECKHIGVFDTKDEAESAYWRVVKLIRNDYLRGSI